MSTTTVITVVRSGSKRAKIEFPNDYVPQNNTIGIIYKKVV